MEFIIIEKSKLKVTLTESDMRTFNVEAGELDYTTPETKRMLRKILNIAEEELGFICDEHRTLVQVYTSKKGDCEIFITRLEDTETENATDYRTIHKDSKGDCSRGIFSFDKLEYLLSVCRRLHLIGYSKGSSAYVGEDRRFYLLLDGLPDPEYVRLNEYTFIYEYGEGENILATIEYLSEHGKEISSPDAVKTLSPL